jgi:hypothetical protein
MKGLLYLILTGLAWVFFLTLGVLAPVFGFVAAIWLYGWL